MLPQVAKNLAILEEIVEKDKLPTEELNTSVVVVF